MVKWWKPAALLAVTFVLAVSLKHDFVFFLLGFELMVYLAAYCQVLWLSKRVRLRVSVPQPQVFRGESFQIRAELTNLSRLPVPQLMARLAVRAFPEREELLLKGKVMLDSSEQGHLCFQMDSSHCGCLEIRPDRLMVTDFLGVFQRRCRVDRDEKHLLFILPESLCHDAPLADIQGVFPDEDGDSEKRGSSAADISEIRRYQENDSLKLVHWKLSARMNDLMVKEMTDPAQRMPWLYLNLQEAPGLPEVRRNPDLWDHFVETVGSLSARLMKIEKRHMVVWIDSLGSKAVSHCVSDEMSLQQMLRALLRADSVPPRDYSQLLKETCIDETQDTCIEIDLQGNLVRSNTPG